LDAALASSISSSVSDSGECAGGVGSTTPGTDGDASAIVARNLYEQEQFLEEFTALNDKIQNRWREFRMLWFTVFRGDEHK